LFCLIVALTCCKKDHSVLGVDVQPKGDAFNTSFSDTLSIFAHTIKIDSTDCANDRYKFLGSNQDPYFGRIDAGIYLNANMNLTDLDFGGDANIRSAEIILAVDNLEFIGSTSAQLTYSVFGLDSALSTSRLYYTSNTLLHDPKLLLSTYTTSFTVYNGRPVVRIPISKSYAEAILTNPAYLTSNDAFIAAYKGFYITTSGTALNSGSQGVIYKCDLEDDVSGFYLNYQNGMPSATKADKSFKFTFSGVSAARFNTVKYHPEQGGASNLLQQVVNNDSLAGKQNLFLGGLGITKVKVSLPGLRNYADSFRVAVSRAEMIFHIDPAFMPAVGQYSVPLQLALMPMDSLGREMYALDQVDNVRYDGTYDADNNRYVFNIARHAQLIMDGAAKNYGFYLIIANTSLLYPVAYNPPSKDLVLVRRDDDERRVVLAGINQGILKPTFNLSYVKLKTK
jgi:hypothetical protein